MATRNLPTGGPVGIVIYEFLTCSCPFDPVPDTPDKYDALEHAQAVFCRLLDHTELGTEMHFPQGFDAAAKALVTASCAPVPSQRFGSPTSSAAAWLLHGARPSTRSRAAIWRHLSCQRRWLNFGAHSSEIDHQPSLSEAKLRQNLTLAGD